ncbi:MAG: 16S rRNA (cytosine(1402)-N(4))-methyltransferase RsmH [Verrucomicrobia bacterium]|jgi:16S rRNA (cytosine1402-N4)-methyltransferase|nr:16S rRNA (cytosine(1402)-N(4))-methyltransferase RsmH [Verrucomicrobiota bacterium]
MHEPVLMDEVLRFLDIREGGIYIDGTMGSGGHSEAILERIGVDGMLLAIDRDQDAIERCGHRLSRFGNRCRRVHGNYADVAGLAARAGLEKVDGILLDLGVSSDQIDTPERGFSFMHDGPLDMRMDQSVATTAAELVNSASEQDLVSILRTLGEERSAKRVAAAIVHRRNARPFETTGDLAEVISEAKGGRRGRTHPATQSFQALRMEVNRELDGVEAGLKGGLELLKDGGRMAVITFHSLEDRMVKHFFAAHEGRWKSLAAGGEAWEGELPPMKRITRKPVQPTDDECRSNPRARSSKLRVAERIASPFKKGRY